MYSNLRRRTTRRANQLNEDYEKTCVWRLLSTIFLTALGTGAIKSVPVALVIIHGRPHDEAPDVGESTTNTVLARWYVTESPRLLERSCNQILKTRLQQTGYARPRVLPYFSSKIASLSSPKHSTHHRARGRTHKDIHACAFRVFDAVRSSSPDVPPG